MRHLDSLRIEHLNVTLHLGSGATVTGWMTSKLTSDGKRAKSYWTQRGDTHVRVHPLGWSDLVAGPEVAPEYRHLINS